MKLVPVIFILVLHSTAIPLLAQDYAQLDNTPSNNSLEIPPPPAVSLPEDPTFTEPVKTPLSWRSKALALANEYPFKEKNSLLWVLPISYDKGLLFLKRAISQIGLDLMSEYPDAGQFLLSEPNTGRRSEIIIVSHPVSASSTIFKLRIYSGNYLNGNTKVNSIPQVMKDLLDKGLWQ